MKIRIVHDECGRESLVQQVLESEGHCPWDGKPFTRDYTASLVESLETAESAGSALETALDRIVGMGAAFRIDRDSLVGPLEQAVERLASRAKSAR